MQVLDVRSGEGDSWEHWNEQQLIEFITRHAGLRIATPQTAPAAASTTAHQDAALPAHPVTSPLQPSPVALRSVELITPATGAPSRFIKTGEPFEIRLAVGNAQTAPHSYAVSVFAKRWEDNSRCLLAHREGVLQASDDAIVINVAQPSLLPGVYRFEAALEAGATKNSGLPAAVAKSHILQVY